MRRPNNEISGAMYRMIYAFVGLVVGLVIHPLAGLAAVVLLAI